jgi:hypothetical protein
MVNKNTTDASAENLPVFIYEEVDHIDRMEEVDDQDGIAHITITLVLECRPREVTAPSKSVNNLTNPPLPEESKRIESVHLHQGPGYNARSTVVKQLEIP